MHQGCMSLVAIIDWLSRYVLAWQLSHTLEPAFCLEALHRALVQGCPQLFNTDQGVQCTSRACTGCLAQAGVMMSMDGRGRALDNIFVERLWRSVTYADLYLKDSVTVPVLIEGLARYFQFYNDQRPHQRLAYRTPAEVHWQPYGCQARNPPYFWLSVVLTMGSSIALHATQRVRQIDLMCPGIHKALLRHGLHEAFEGLVEPPVAGRPHYARHRKLQGGVQDTGVSTVWILYGPTAIRWCRNCAAITILTSVYNSA